MNYKSFPLLRNLDKDISFKNQSADKFIYRVLHDKLITAFILCILIRIGSITAVKQGEACVLCPVLGHELTGG